MPTIQYLGIAVLAAITLASANCPQNPTAPNPPTIFAKTGLSAVAGPTNYQYPYASTDLFRWEGETNYYYTSHTGAGTGIRSNGYSMLIPYMMDAPTGSRFFVKNSTGSELEKIAETTAPDANKDQYALGFVADAHNPFFYVVISPRTNPSGSIYHGVQLTYRLGWESAAGQAETPINVTYIAAGRCRANSIQLSDINPKKGDSVAVDWDAGDCKAAVVLRTPSSTSMGPYVFQRATPQYNSSFTGSYKVFQIQVDTSYQLSAIDAVWRSATRSVKATVQQPQPGSPPSTPCANNAPLQSFDFCVECPTGVPGEPPYRYSYPGYRACTEASGKTELQNNFRGCDVKTGSCPP